MLDKQPGIKEKCQLWNPKSQTNQFFVLLNALLLRLAENIELNKSNEDPLDYPFQETQKDSIWNIVLVACIWSFGAVLNKEQRKNIFHDKFMQENKGSKFVISFNQPQKQSFFTFDYFFDVERLSWGLLSEKLEYRLKLHYDVHS
jgi:hypothetical protein